MPTFTEASLIAAGTGALLWAVLAAEASTGRRTWVGLAGLVGLEAATFSRYTHVVVLGCAAIAVLVAWRLRAARLPGSAAALAERDLTVGVALAASWAAIWALYVTYTWTAAAGLSTPQAARFYVPALGAISLPGAWLLVRVPRRQPLAAITTLVVAGVLFGLGGWAFHHMYQFPFGRQLVVVHGPGGTVELKPGPGVRIGRPRRRRARRP